MARYFAEYGHMALRPGELCYLAVASEEPAGKPFIACGKVQVAPELAAPEDQQSLQHEAPPPSCSAGLAQPASRQDGGPAHDGGPAQEGTRPRPERYAVPELLRSLRVGHPAPCLSPV